MTVDTRSQTSSPGGECQTGGRQPGDRAAEVLDSLGAAVLVADGDGAILYRNAIAASWLPDGGDLDSVLAAVHFLESFDGWPVVLRRVLDAGESLRFGCALRLPGVSSPVLGDLRCTPLRERCSQRIIGVTIVIEKGVHQEAVDERVEVSNRLASLGKLATRVAHELNNPLDGILRYINLSMRLVEDTPEPKLKSYLAESRTGLRRMVQIIADLLEFSRTTDGAFDEMSINEVVEQAIRGTASAADAAGVVVAADFQSQDMPLTRGSRFYQVCCNLIKNAIDAMPDGGRLTITTGLIGEEVVIRVVDTGVGLPEPNDKVFEPFFTTKEPGKGTGLGLAICKDFIEDMQGTITAAPGEERGAVFTVRIPTSSCHRAPRMMAEHVDRDAAGAVKTRR